MTEAPKTYEIRTVLDLLAWVYLVKLARSLPGAAPIKGHDVFLWSDDGKNECRLHLRTPEGSTLTATFGPDGISVNQEPAQ